MLHSTKYRNWLFDCLVGSVFALLFFFFFFSFSVQVKREIQNYRLKKKKKYKFQALFSLDLFYLEMKLVNEPFCLSFIYFLLALICLICHLGVRQLRAQQIRCLIICDDTPESRINGKLGWQALDINHTQNTSGKCSHKNCLLAFDGQRKITKQNTNLVFNIKQNNSLNDWLIVIE